MDITIPTVIQAAIDRGAVVAVSVSAGKDSQALEVILARLREQRNWPGIFFAIHADIGPQFDWAWTIQLCERNAQALGHPLYVVRREGETLMDTIRKRTEKTGKSKPGFPSPACRFCTRSAKTDPIDKTLRRSGNLILNVMGLRADESRRRSKTKPVSVRASISAEHLKKLTPEEALAAWRPDKERLALDWNPVLEWSFDDVLQACGNTYSEMLSRRELFNLGCYEMAFSGWKLSPTYILGLDRHSCAICCMSAKAEIPIIAGLRPDLIQEIAELEEITGFSWQEGNPLSAFLDVPTTSIPAQATRIQPLPLSYGQGAGITHTRQGQQEHSQLAAVSWAG